MLPLTGDEKGLELGGLDIQRRQARVERFKGLDGKKTQRTVDGVHVHITEPKHAAKQYYSHKFKKSALNFELGVGGVPKG
jgi:hypothetical protein